MIFLDPEDRPALLAHINSTPKEADFEIANRECEASCKITSLTLDTHDEVASIEVELIALNGLPPEWFHRGIVLVAESKLRCHEVILRDVRGIVQEVVEMEEEHRGDWTGGNKMDEARDTAEDRKRRIA